MSSRRRPGGRARREGASQVHQLPWQQVVQPYAPLRGAVGGSDRSDSSHIAAHSRGARDGGDVGARPRAAQGGRRAGGSGEPQRAPRAGPRRARASRARPRSSCSRRETRPGASFWAGNHLNFGLVAGPANVHDCERGRRPGNLHDYCDLVRLAQYLQRHPSDRQSGVRADRAAGELSASRHLSGESALFGSCVSLHRDRRAARARRHPDDGDRARPRPRAVRREPRRDHHHFGQQPAPLR